MKYYLYISDSKVDMLLPQIPGEAKRKIATEFKIDIKIFGAARKTESMIGEDRIGRLLAVVEHINDNEDVGTPDRPNTYFAGTLPMRWGPFAGFKRDRYEESPIVYFSGQTDTTLVGLGGSSKHVIGNVGPSNPGEWPGSAGPMLLQILIENIDLEDQELMARSRSSHYQIGVDPSHDLDSLGCRMDFTFTGMSGPEQRLEFLAKRILAGKSGWSSARPFVTLGTPLYVALAE